MTSETSSSKIITTERFQDQDNVASNIGNAGAAEAGLLLLSALEHAHVGQKVALCSFNDGVEILIFEVAGDNKVVNPIEHQIKTDPTFPMENSFNGVKCYLYNHLTDRHPLGSPPLLEKRIRLEAWLHRITRRPIRTHSYAPITPLN